VRARSGISILARCSARSSRSLRSPGFAGFGLDLACAPGRGGGAPRATRSERRAFGRGALLREARGAERKRKESIMLRIYPVCLDMVREVRPYADRIARFDRDLARQLRRSSTAVVLNTAEGSGLRGGRRRQAYEIALGEARETLANLEAAHAIGYAPAVGSDLRQRLNHIIGTLVRLIR
jgi:four helix bundle protein